MRKPSSWAMCPSWDGYRKRVGQPAQVRKGKAMKVEFKISDSEITTIYSAIHEWDGDEHVGTFFSPDGDVAEICNSGRRAAYLECDSAENVLTFCGKRHQPFSPSIQSIFTALGWVEGPIGHPTITMKGEMVECKIISQATTRPWRDVIA